MRYILNCDPSQASFAMTAALRLEEEGFEECVFTFKGGAAMYARRNKASISVFQNGWGATEKPPGDRGA